MSSAAEIAAPARLRSNAPMQEESLDRIERRLTDIEIKAAYAEDTIDRLNDVIVRQQRQIDALLRELADLRARGGPVDADAAAARGVVDERPPHY